MAKKGEAERERAAAGVVPFRSIEGNAEPALEDAPAAKPGRRARVVPIARARAIAAAGPRVKARAGRAEGAAAEPAEATQTRGRRQVPGYHPTAKLAGKVALITAGDSGIGQAVARLFAREGADAAVVYAAGELSGAAELRGEIEAAGQHALLLPGDVREPDFCKQAVERAVAEYGQLDLLVICTDYPARSQPARSQPAHSRRIEDLRYEDWDAALKTSIYSTFLMTQAAAPHLARQAAIINIGTNIGTGAAAGGEPGRDPVPLEIAASQGAIQAFTRALALNLAERGIRVNGVLGSPQRPEEFAPACVFFASAADSGQISGETLALGH